MMLRSPFAVAVAVLVATSGSTTSAFVPSSSFTQGSGRMAFSTAARPARVCRGSTSTALSMNLFDRFARVAKSNANNILKKLEDPEKIMSQAVEDMQADLVKIRQSYAEVTANQRRLLKQKEQADAVADEWYGRAQLALQSGKEDLAREALSRRQQQVDAAASLQSQIDAQVANIDKLYEGMQAVESKILEAKSRKDEFVARARTAQSTQQVNDMLGGVTGKTSMDAFTRMEEKVEALEAQAEVSGEMGSLTGNALPGSASSSLEKEFKMLEGSSAVDDELKKMKGLLSDSSSAEEKPKSKSSGNPAVDIEMEKLKRDAGL